jgi:hypothetical protein
MARTLKQARLQRMSKKGVTKVQRFSTTALEGSLVGRAALMGKLGYQYGGDRDVYEALGYPLILTFDDYYSRYQRQDIAKAIIDRPAKATWRGKFKVFESNDDKETQLEKDFNELNDRLRLKSVFFRADKLSGIGTYGAMFLGLNDAKSDAEQINPVHGKPKLLYVKPLTQNSAQIKTKVENSADPRFGLPELYSINVATDNREAKTIDVHWTRVVHIVRNKQESEIEGEPELKAVYNRLMDIEKLVGSSAEMFWRGGRPGFHAGIDPDYDVDGDAEDAFQSQIDEYEHNLRRILFSQGTTITPLAMQVADPSGHLDIQIQMISSETGIPKRILTGSERGELSSQQDKDEWDDYVESRREDLAESQIIRPFVDRLIDFGILAKPGKDGYQVQWPDLRTSSDEEKAKVGEIRARALQAYAANTAAQDILPENAFFQFCLGLDDEAAEYIEEMRKAEVGNEVEDNTPEIEEEEENV